MGRKEYEYEDLNSLDDESLGTLLSSCPYRLLAFVLKATPESMRERMLGLLDGHKKQLVLPAFSQFYGVFIKKPSVLPAKPGLQQHFH